MQNLRFQRNNLTKRERVALNRLSNNTDIIIKPADKGGATAIMNTKDYVKLSAYVNEFLRPIAEKLPSYIQDTTHFIKPSLEVEANVLFNGYIEETNHRICKFLCSVWLCTTQSSQRNAESAYTDSIGILADQRT